MKLRKLAQTAMLGASMLCTAIAAMGAPERIDFSRIPSANGQPIETHPGYEWKLTRPHPEFTPSGDLRLPFARPVKSKNAAALSSQATAQATATPIPQMPHVDRTFTYKVMDLAVNPNAATNPIMTFTHTILGGDPAEHERSTLRIVLIPVSVALPDGTIADPTKTVLPFDTATTFQAVQESPVFRRVPITIGGVNYGQSQLLDAWMRAERFPSLDAADDYHVDLAVTVGKPALLNSPASVLDYGLDHGANRLWIINSFDLMNQLMLSYIADPANGITNKVIPVFVTDFSIFVGGAGGYHDNQGDQIFTWVGYEVPFDRTTGLTIPGPRDGLIMEHELAEIIDHPLPENDNGGPCFNYGYEVGDPLEFGQADFNLKSSSGVEYHFQDLTFFGYNEGTFPSPSLKARYSMQPGIYHFPCSGL